MSEVTTSATGITENAPVTEVSTNESGKATLQAGETALTFDELDEVLSKKTPKSKDLTSDTDKGKAAKSEKAEPKEKAVSKTDAKNDTSKEELKVDDKAKLEAEKPRKTVKAKTAESEIEIDEEALIPVTIDGKEEMWTLKELRAQQSGKVAYDKKFSELDKLRKDVSHKDQRLTEVNSKIKSIFEEQDPDLRMYKIAQVAGVDPIEYRNKFFDENIKMLEKWYTMSDDERRASASDFESKVHKHRADTLENSIKQQQTDKELLSKVESIRASHQIDEAKFYNRVDELTKQVEAGKIKPEALTPEFVAETIVIDRLWEPAAQKIDSLNLGWNSEKRAQVITELVQDCMKLGIKPQDVSDIVDEVYGVKKAQRKVEQKQQENKQFISGKTEVKSYVAPKNEPLTFDDI